MAAHVYLTDLPDPALLDAPSTRRPRDQEPAATAAAIAALQAVHTGKLDRSTTTADAFDPVALSDIAEDLPAATSYAFVTRRRLPSTVTIHDHQLTDYVLIEVRPDNDHRFHLAVYRDPHGKIAYIAPL